MNPNVLRLVVPCVLGLVGFGLNHATIVQTLRPGEVLAVSESIPVGGRIGERALMVVEVPGMTKVMRDNLIPSSARGVVLERKVLRKLEPNQLLLYSDLDNRDEAPSKPDNCELIYIPLDRLPCRRDLLQPGSQVYFLVKSREDQSPARIGPYQVYEGPSNPAEQSDGSPISGVPNAVGLLLDQTQPERVAAIHEAIARDHLRAIEIEPK
jgi:hypothetical protein